MSLAEQYLKAGNLTEALTQLQSQIKKDPSNATLRTFLFQLLAVLGQWDRALAQLNVTGELDAMTLPMVQNYREAIRCELLRTQVFLGRHTPQIFGEPQQWIALLVQALKLTADKNYQEAKQLRDQAFELAPFTAGSINTEDFEWLADADSRLGPLLEVFIDAQYFWMPFTQIKSISIEAPADLRDLVWLPVRMVLNNDSEFLALIPTRYPESEVSEDNLIKLARKTEWLNCGEDTYLGLGQRILTTNNNDYALLDVREILFNN